MSFAKLSLSVLGAWLFAHDWRPTGVEHLPEAMRAAGLLKMRNAEYVGKVSPLRYDSKREEVHSY